jgi:hypothetical protein
MTRPNAQLSVTQPNVYTAKSAGEHQPKRIAPLAATPCRDSDRAEQRRKNTSNGADVHDLIV